MTSSRPALARSVNGLRTSVFAKLADKIKAMGPSFIPMHIGDTYRLPPEAARLEKVDASSPSFYKYAHPHGQPELLEALSHKLKTRNQIPAGTDAIQVANGATGALAAAIATVLDPDDEVLVMAPFWPLITGVMSAMRVKPVQIPYGFDLSPYLTERTRAVYFGTPNNPDGRVATRSELEQLARQAQQHDLWVLSDEVYEDYVFEGEHLSIASLPGMFDRTLSAYSFSKSYALAGARVGYVVAHPEVMNPLRRVANHQFYNVSLAMQMCALGALLHGADWLEESRQLYEQARLALHAGLAERCPLSQGGAYLFLELESEQAMWGLLERALEAGVGLAPGEAFGERYRHCVRICYTAAPLESVKKGAEILHGLL